ncbi:hypothetical protein EJ04DRAFT_570537 [Polyplosphaeria fusca]|uniref:Uncharacterized protein n=1 Tax=Polyplosphaeria fusca TaxID=682080 RepID=A0A9P4QKQ6_9PLEO|nr:hypothetical protein EJ04DRAFT_570537 [Polyplosphaeria fusca]
MVLKYLLVLAFALFTLVQAATGVKSINNEKPECIALYNDLADCTLRCQSNCHCREDYCTSCLVQEEVCDGEGICNGFVADHITGIKAADCTPTATPPATPPVSICRQISNEWDDCNTNCEDRDPKCKAGCTCTDDCKQCDHTLDCIVKCNCNGCMESWCHDHCGFDNCVSEYNALWWLDPFNQRHRCPGPPA